MVRYLAVLMAGCLVLLALSAGTKAPQRDVEAVLRAARQHFEHREFADAAASARAARSLDPRRSEPWKIEGVALQLAGRIPDAANTLASALELFPKDPDLWFYLGRVLFLNHQLKPAEAAVRTALRFKPDLADAQTQLGMILEARLNFAGALAAYSAAIDLGSGNGHPEVMPLVNSARLLMQLGRFKEGLGRATAARKLQPRSGPVHLLRAQLLEKLGRGEDALREYEEASENDGGPTARSSILRLRALSGVAASTVVKDDAPAAGLEGQPIVFRNEAKGAGLDFVIRNSAGPARYQVETMVGGVAAFDYDNDGWPDIYFVNGAELPGMRKTSPAYWNRLFHNNRDGTFTDVTAAAGVAAEGYGMGTAVGDYDNDGNADLFVAGVHRNFLFRNRGDGTFEDVTARAGLSDLDSTREKMWSVAAAWLDYDRDGYLDLFVVNYCRWAPGLDPYCGGALPGQRTYCFPDRYEGLPNQLFHNNGNGTFTDVSQESGIGRHIGKGMGIAVADFDQDGWMDVFVANDTLPNFLFHNNGRGGFDEVALQSGVAVQESGQPVSGMGADFRDYNNDGRPDLIVSALDGEAFPLFRNLTGGFFTDETFTSRLGLDTIKRTGWGVGFYDFNNDGFKDLFTSNANVNDNIELFNEQRYRQPNGIFLNLGNGTFRDASSTAGSDFKAAAAHRGCAFADFNNDGRIDVVTVSLDEPAELWINHSPGKNHWILLDLVGTQSNRLGIGAFVTLISQSGARQFNHVTTSVGYASSSDQRVHFGLGSENRIRSLEIRWPSGTVQTLKDLAADQILRVTEPSRSIKNRPR